MVTVESVVPEISHLVREYYLRTIFPEIQKCRNYRGGNSTQTKFILIAILVTD